MAEMIWRNERRKVSELSDHPTNPRILTEKGMSDLRKSIEACGYVEPIAINTNGRILSGHARRKILEQAGLTEVDVRVPERELTEAEEREVLVRMNKNVAGEFDYEILANDFEIEELKDYGFDNAYEDDSELAEVHKAKPYSMTRVLVLFPPSKFAEVREHFEALQRITGVVFEQNSF